MSRTRKLTAALALGVAVATTLSACGDDSDGEKVTFGYIGDYNGTSLLAIADDQGLWEKHGLEVDAKVFTNGPLQIQALGTGDLDFGYIGPGAFWMPASGQAKIVAINTLGNADRVIAQDRGSRPIEQLRGKTVAVPEGTSGDMILTLALANAGMTKQDVKVVNMDPSTIVSAFASKQVDAAGFWYPAIETIKDQVPELSELAKNSDFESQMAFPTAFVGRQRRRLRRQGEDREDASPCCVRRWSTARPTWTSRSSSPPRCSTSRSSRSRRTPPTSRCSPWTRSTS